MNALDYLHVGLHVGEVGAIIMMVHDLLWLRNSVDSIEIEDEDFVREDRKLESQDDQLRVEVDEMRQAIDFLRRAQSPRVSGSPPPKFSERETLEMAGPPPAQEGDTRVFSPNEPKLPSFNDDAGNGLGPSFNFGVRGRFER
jgi:hypothetical protein